MGGTHFANSDNIQPGTGKGGNNDWFLVGGGAKSGNDQWNFDDAGVNTAVATGSILKATRTFKRHFRLLIMLGVIALQLMLSTTTPGTCR